MKHIHLFLITLLLFLTLSSLTILSGENNQSESITHIKMTVSGIKTADGKIQVGAFIDNESFKNEKSTFAFHFNKNEIKDGTLVVEFDLPTDIYGFSLMDDENDNNVMDYNFFGIPKEGFGFGDYYHSGFSKPNFDAFKMTLKEGETREIAVKMRYVL